MPKPGHGDGGSCINRFAFAGPAFLVPLLFSPVIRRFRQIRNSANPARAQNLGHWWLCAVVRNENGKVSGKILALVPDSIEYACQPVV